MKANRKRDPASVINFGKRLDDAYVANSSTRLVADLLALRVVV